jgi:Zn-dependent protease
VGFGEFHLSRFELVFYALLIPAIILHEVSHGWVALMFGDDTAKRAGRLTLNPIPHIDLFGTIILPALLLVTTGRAFGYAKPVPVNPRNLRNPRDQGLLVSLAGPAVNIVLMVAATVLIRQIGLGHHDPFGDHGDPLNTAVVAVGLGNLLLAVFNLIPIPPLDGSAVIERVMPRSWWPGYMRFRQYSMGILLILVLVFPRYLGEFLNFFVLRWFRFLV